MQSGEKTLQLWLYQTRDHNDIIHYRALYAWKNLMNKAKSQPVLPHPVSSTATSKSDAASLIVPALGRTTELD